MNKGFSLIELMIVVAIIGILAAIAYPSYQQNMIDSRRAKAAGCVMEMSQFMEKFYSGVFVYTGAVLPASQCTIDLANFYTLAVAIPTSQTYIVTATAAGAQLNDSRSCGNLTINQAGTKGASGSGTVAECWRQ